jgi:hypothetical protein
MPALAQPSIDSLEAAVTSLTSQLATIKAESEVLKRRVETSEAENAALKQASGWRYPDRRAGRAGAKDHGGRPGEIARAVGVLIVAALAINVVLGIAYWMTLTELAPTPTISAPDTEPPIPEHP